jgi:hypothetical protein
MQKAPISVRIIHVLTVVVSWILIVVAAVSFLGSILLETNVIGDEFQLRIKLPVTFDVVETGKVPLLSVMTVLTDLIGYIVAILLWVVAHVFMKGVAMKEEQELTI